MFEYSHRRFFEQLFTEHCLKERKKEKEARDGIFIEKQIVVCKVHTIAEVAIHSGNGQNDKNCAVIKRSSFVSQLLSRSFRRK